MRKSVVTTVLTAAASRALTLLATVKDDWLVAGTADDAFLEHSPLCLTHFFVGLGFPCGPE